MPKNQTVNEAREKIRKRMEEYRSLPEYILDGISVLFEKIISSSASKWDTFLPRDASAQENEGSPSYWLNGIAIAFFTFGIGWLVAIVLGEPLNPDEFKLTL